MGALALALLAGSAQALAIAAPWDGQPLWWLQLGSLALVVSAVLRAPSWGRAALLGWAFATAWLVGSWWWLFISMHVYGGLAAPLAALAVLLLAAFLASYYAGAFGLFWALRRTHAAWAAMVFAACWTLAELARAIWLTGFPWGAGGYAHVEGPLAAFAPWVGVHGIGFMAATLAAGAALLERTRRGATAAWSLLPALAVLAAVHQISPPEGFSRGAGSVSVALLQGNIAQDEKFQGATGIPDALDWYGRQLREAPAQMVVAPETAIPLLPLQLPDDYLPALGQAFAGGQRAALVGIPLGSLSEGYTNSVIGVGPQPPVYRYDKHHLVPFGEFIPPFFRWFTDLMHIPLGDFNRGSVGQPSFTFAGQQWAPNICYEDLFGEELAARFGGQERAPTVFVNVSNIAWFGNTVAIAQHLHISRMRALEFERPMLRATNTGATAVIDHRGQVRAQLAPHTRGVLLGEVEGRTGATPYARWAARLGVWPWWLLCAAIVLLAAWAIRNRATA